MSLSVNLRYFAILREQRGAESETCLVAPQTARQLYAALATQHEFTLPPDRIRVAINDSFADLDQDLRDGDTVVFVPPVAGG